MLTAKAPFAGTTREALLKSMAGKPEPLLAAGLTEPVLQEIIARGLLADRRQRAIDLNELQASLDNWEREPTRMPPPRPLPRAAPRGLGDIVAGTAFGNQRDDGVITDDAAWPDDQGTPDRPIERLIPESLPPAVPVTAPVAAVDPPLGVMPAVDLVPRAPRRISFNPFERKATVWPWVVVAALASGGGVYVALGPTAKPEPTPPPSAAPAPRAAAPKPPAKRDADVVRNECVAQHFPAGAFEADANFAFVCEDGEFPTTVRRLYSLAQDPNAGSDAGTGLDAGLAVRLTGNRKPDAGAPRSGLDWYELPATAIIRKTCCPNSSPIVLPELPGWCEQLQSVVRRIADDSAKSVDLGPGARSFDRAVGCLFAGRVKHGYAYPTGPSPANRAVFQQFLSRAAIVSTKR
jgi:hypothetical protein